MRSAVLVLAVSACSGAAPVATPPAKPAPTSLPVMELGPPFLGEYLERVRVEAEAARARRPWLVGSTHVHTLYSGDSRTRVEKVIKWYGEAGYDFIVITDHNRVTDGVSANFRNKHDLLVLKGTELTNNPPKCDPPPPEEKGKCRIHVNSLFVERYPATKPNERPEKMDWREKKSIARVDLYQAALDKNKELGGLAQLNHPTWHWGVDGELSAELAKRGMRFIEIANVAFAPWNGGNKDREGTEAIWDAALSAGHRMWGVASDDAHHYYDIEKVKANGGNVYPAGRGVVVVRADRSPAAIREAMERGDFYASTGIRFSRLEVSATELIVEIEPTERRGVGVQFIGNGGAILEEVSGNSARFELARARGGYVRARAVASDGSRAWTQPVFVD